MKKYIVVMLCLPILAFGQLRGHNPIKAKLINTITNWTNSTSSATAWLAVTPVEALEAREVGLIFVATDSVQKIVTIAGANSQFSSLVFTDSYADSISSWGLGTTPDGATAANTQYTKVIMLKDGTVNRLEACDRFKVTVASGAAGAQGNTAGRTIKVYLWWNP